MKITDTAVIVPAMNEGGVTRENLENILRFFATVILVDDGSTDKTRAEAQKTGAIILSHPFNLGAGAATETGIEFALTLPNVKYFATIDADGQHLPEDLIKMREQLIKNQDDIVIGSRFLGETRDMPKIKKILMKIAVKFSNLTTKTQFTDTHNGIRIFNRHVAETLDIRENGYQHCSEIIDKIVKNHYKFSEAPVTIIYTEYSKSKGQSMLNAVNIGFDVLFGKVIKR